MPMKVIDINVGEMAAGIKDLSIRTSGIGSCMVVCLYDEKTKVGGMIHSMLPTRNQNGPTRQFMAVEDVPSPAKYLDEGIDHLLAEVERLGGRRERLVAKLVGGSRMFKFMHDEKTSIGTKNIEMAQKKLAELSILIEGEDTGGTIGRMAEFNLENGLLDISIKI